MIKNVNDVTFGGNLVDDVQVSYLPSGTPIAKFRLANDTYAGKDPTTGESRYQTLFMNVDYVNRAAEDFQMAVSKGRSILVIGKLRSYQAGNEIRYYIDASEVSYGLETSHSRVRAPGASQTPYRAEDAQDQQRRDQSPGMHGGANHASPNYERSHAEGYQHQPQANDATRSFASMHEHQPAPSPMRQSRMAPPARAAAPIRGSSPPPLPGRMTPSTSGAAGYPSARQQSAQSSFAPSQVQPKAVPQNVHPVPMRTSTAQQDADEDWGF